jgi:hypothetical protein
MIIKSLISASSPRADGGLCQQHHGIWLGNHQRGNHSLRTPPRETTQPLFFYARWVRKVSEFPAGRFIEKFLVIWIALPDNFCVKDTLSKYSCNWFFREMLTLGIFLSMILYTNVDPRKIPVYETMILYRNIGPRNILVLSFLHTEYSAYEVQVNSHTRCSYSCLWNLLNNVYFRNIFLPVKLM